MDTAPERRASSFCRLFTKLAISGVFLVLPLACGGGNNDTTPPAEPTPTPGPVLDIATPPTDQTVIQGQAATFSVTASGGKTPYTYQWLRDGAAMTSSGTGNNLVLLGNAASFTTMPTTMADDGVTYTVKVTDAAAASVTSAAVTLHANTGFTNPVTEADYTLISPNYGSDNFYYVGRIDATAPAAPVLIWEGTTVKAKFHGKTLGVKFGKPQVSWRNTNFNIIVDGEIRLLSLSPSGTNFTYLWDGPLPTATNDDHDLTIFKRSEGNETWAAFLGVYLDKAETALGTKPAAATKRIEFYGDSFTAGAYTEFFPFTPDDGTLPYSSVAATSAKYMTTFNNYPAYGAVAARALGADYSCIAVSGIGVSLGWGSINMPAVVDRLYYPDGNSPKKPETGDANKYDFAGNPKADVVVINLGQNDRGKSSNAGIAFPADFQAKYVAMVQAIRGFYPSATIVCALGGMSAGQDATMISNFDGAVSTLKATDTKIFSFKFVHFTNDHPRDYDHQILADELVKFLKDNSIF